MSEIVCVFKKLKMISTK